MSEKIASTDYPIHELLAQRWSPYEFEDRPVSEADLCSLFEAARWAASSYNEQPWSYIIATKDNPKQFAKLLSCLVDANQIWAKNAPAIALGIVKLKFTHNNQDNRCAIHDLGLASANLVVEAMARGIYVHQMGGILPDKARDLFNIPDGFEAWTGMAIGYHGNAIALPDAMKERDSIPRQRKPLPQFVFSENWGNPSPLVQK
ncbi:MAG TPA: nitroreductase [Cyanobacteria bacterium UBA11149]|nr:nitroreductase [Cyanobacteria bacterium UBA11367]HBE57154.1 nitroreductase [Cyanobacteria bacterium UBA11366]HBK63489.1 nitroreductase [Cyanobacteria bacterium UBA11166]HBR72845.1 nitroreductase [Cyanobacteria bacterium UBA11159]HBS67809.1 nitroreductase [Cyanobacteria bacterium UBA11153]HBW91573.1 nitroreductase [Cyanobacteria bacterium UBA11149]HCA93330.1 nitroreductase [Cyanobacteria bacterium UBA9226]